MNTTTVRFQELGSRYLKAMFDFMPQRGSGAGLHEYDGRQPDVSRPAIEARRRALEVFRQELDGLPVAELSPEDAFDYRLLHAELDEEIYKWEERQEYR